MAIDSVGYYALPVIPSFQGMDRHVNAAMSKSFGGLGHKLGTELGDGVGKGIQSSAGKVAAAAKTHTAALDKVKDASAKLRTEEAKLDALRKNAGARASAVGTAERRLKELRDSGKATNKQLEAAEKAVATARERARNTAAQVTAAEGRVSTQRRKEAAASREATAAERELAAARRTTNTAGAVGNPLRGAREAMAGSASGLAGVAGGIGKKVGGAFMGAVAGVVSVAAVGKLFTSALETGVDFERSVNAFSGVTAQAGDTAEITTARMNAMREAARALGSDTQLAGVSTRQAGDAMVELAKGGMTAQQAMEAARGTLQLATAGQLDAAEAASIQSAAINTFSLTANDAGRVADLLAAAANASSAEVTDLGMALKQGGAVASGFGVSIEDTLTALTMFSRMGINGSDAGTMLKTSLQAITDQGNPAQGAIEQLGLTLYDAQGVFVGVESMMKQVAEASGRMTQEQFQAATAVLFGSDAMRASMVAAKGGAAAWDDAAAAVTREGAAADMAAAQMQGLPGVVEALSNTWEAFKLALFDVLDGPLIAIGNWFTDIIDGGGPDWIREFGDTFKAVFSDIGAAVAPVKGIVGDLGDAFQRWIMPALTEYMGKLKGPLTELGRQVGATFREALPVLKLVGMVLGGVLLAAIKAVSITVPLMLKAFTLGQKAAQLLFAALKAGVPIVTGVAKVIGGVFVGAWNLLKAAASAAGSALSPVFSAIKAGLGALATVGRYVFDTVLLPMWNNLKLAASTTAAQLAPVWDGIKAAFGAVGDAATAFYQGAILPAWEAVKGAFSAGWAAISPIFQRLKDAFQDVRNFVGSVWNGLAGVVKKALDAVIEAVKGPLRWIGRTLQKVPTSIGPVQIPGAQAAKDLGNSLAGLRDGGVAGRTRDGRLWGPGTGRSDSILGLDAAGRPTALVSAGEGIVTDAAMNRGGAPLVAALNNGWVPPAGLLHAMLPGYRDGGRIAEADYFAQTVGDGRPYVYGGVGPGFDCSGLQSAIYAVLTGQDPGKRHFTTESNFEALGFQPGYMPGAYNIGIRRGGGGRLSHMAGTLPNGVNVESGGNHNSTLYGGDAAGAQDFPLQFHLPVGGGDPSGGVAGGMSQALLGRVPAGSTAGTNARGEAGYFTPDAAKIREAEAKVREVEARQREVEAKKDAKESEKLRVERQLDTARTQLEEARRGKFTKFSKADLDAAEGGGGESKETQLGELGSIAKSFLQDTFGLGDLLPDPSELGIVKLAQAMLGIKYTPQGKGFPWQVGYPNGDGTPWSGTPSSPLDNLTGEATAGLGSIVPGVTSMLPDVATMMPAAHGAGAGQPPGPVDASTNVTINNPQGTPEANEMRLRRTLLKTPRLNTYQQNPGVMGK
ncbi:tape measure protein [Mycobacterium phage Weirdo19]|uniref:Tape measure protein n=1 Tax=Mycobacterium phage Weirdo19 TaxID=2601610 RepID=A0A6M2YSR5_9CAUD|nr:tail length tape measure protein [Mycobacterium phage Weirdo19]QEA10784.1 tape measure protein [Mycobacterium phage Weirdo19]